MTKTINLFLIILLLSSCGTAKKTEIEIKEPDQSVGFLPEPTGILLPQKITLHPGYVRKIKIGVPKYYDQSTQITCNDKIKKSHISEGVLTFYLSEKYHSKNKEVHCKITYKNESKKILSAKIKPYPYPFEKLNVPKRHIDLSKKNLARWKREVKIQKKVYASGINYPLFSEPFELPLESKITSQFGKKRIFNNKKDSWHSGTDFRASIGTPIPSANRGKVVFTGDLFFNGKTVIIDHGMGIFTMSCHLSEIKVSEGEIIPKKGIIGLAGKTGRVTGPHLHWGVKVNDYWIKGESLVLEENKHL